MSYTGLQGVEIAQEAHLSGNIREGDPNTFAPRVWRYLLERFAVRSVMDLGSGIGYAADWFYKQGCQVVAIEGLKENCAAALYPTVQWDLTRGAISCAVDLVHCQEVVEHIEEEFIDNLIASLANGRFILLTHALPGQAGYHHVNLKPPEYWISHMRRFGCVLLEEDTKRVREFATQDTARFLAASGMIFTNNRR